jgi:hypothetical protein
MHVEYIQRVEHIQFGYNKINASVIGYHSKVLIKSTWCKSVHAFSERWNKKKCFSSNSESNNNFSL